jgi:putative ATP-dependent endonuclease of OLD family
MGNLLFQWRQGCLEENIIPLISPARIFQLIEDSAAEKTGMRLRTLADRLEIEAADFDPMADRPDQELKNLIVAAATGQNPEHLADAERSIKKPL